MKSKTDWMLVLLLPLAAPANAQESKSSEVPALATAAYEIASLKEQRARSRAPWITLHTLSGTLVGAWLGYMASQAKYSDWDRDESADLGGKRRKYTAFGAGIGSLAGLGFSLKVGPRPSRGSALALARRSNGHVITREEIDDSGLANAYELVQTLRRNWLHERGTHTLRETTQAQSEGNSIRILRVGDPKIIAYLNEAFLGPVELLRDVPAVTVHSIRYYDATAATQRWGAGHTHGAVQVLTQEQQMP